MKERLLLLGVAGILCFTAKAQQAVKDTSYWKKGGNIGINAGQVSLINWAGGGFNSVSGNALLHLFTNYKKDKNAWDNTLDLGYGLIKQDDAPWFKNNDRIELNSKFGRQASTDWYYSAFLNFQSQFAKGYADVNSPKEAYISRFLAPAFLYTGIGMDYKPSDNFSLFISPATSKLIVVNDTMLSNAGAFGVDAGATTRFELGGYLSMMYKTDIMKNISFMTKLNLFSNYIEKPQNIDVSWETFLTMKVNDYISASLTTHLIYDDNIHSATLTDAAGNTRLAPGIQFKQVFGIGFAYKF